MFKRMQAKKGPRNRDQRIFERDNANAMVLIQRYLDL